VLLDGVGKARPDVFNMLLQIPEDGQLIDAQGRKVSFRNTLLVGTSNPGTEALSPEKWQGVLVGRGRLEFIKVSSNRAVWWDNGQEPTQRRAREPHRLYGWHGPVLLGIERAMKVGRMLWILVGLLGLAVAGVALYRVWPLLYPEVVAEAPLDPRCDLRAGSCTGVLPGGGRVRFAIAPRDIPVVKPLRLTVETEGLEVRAVAVDFSGVDMNMGYNRATLQREAPGRFAAQAMLPVCVRARMTWEARVLLRTADGLLAVPFRFDTFQPGMRPGP
jgi:hypothetical protein